jgi:formamidopyrimidine-DNA glycosylase
MLVAPQRALPMPELPDIALYLHALTTRLVGQPLRHVRLVSPFLLRSVTPPLSALEGRSVRALRRLGKRIVFAFDDDYFLVLHLMISGRLRWKAPSAPVPGRLGLAALDFDNGTLIVTEAAAKKRASLFVVHGAEALAEHDPGGLEVLEISEREFAARLRLERRTLKRALTDPRLFSGIGNAYSDEILHAARLSPLQRTTNLDDRAMGELHSAVRRVLAEWTDKLQREAGADFPEKVTAFRDDMAVHGKFGQPCPRCGSPIQRIAYASNECNYCATCQTGGKLLADRSLSRLLGKDWPRTLEELEELKRRPL